MSSDISRREAKPSPTVVPAGISDPVEQARAELKAALFAIEEKVNVPKRLSRATDRTIAKARRFARQQPVVTAVAVIGGAAAVGVAVWGAVRAYIR